MITHRLQIFTKNGSANIRTYTQTNGLNWIIVGCVTLGDFPFFFCFAWQKITIVWFAIVVVIVLLLSFYYWGSCQKKNRFLIRISFFCLLQEKLGHKVNVNKKISGINYYFEEAFHILLILHKVHESYDRFARELVDGAPVERKKNTFPKNVGKIISRGIGVPNFFLQIQTPPENVPNTQCQDLWSKKGQFR